MDRRIFLSGLSGAALVATAANAQATPALTATAMRVDAQRVKLNWTAPASARTTVLMSNQPNAPKPSMRTLQSRIVANELVVEAPTTPRPYFIISTGFGQDVRVAERLLPLQGGRNFRDLGGYTGTAGRAVKWGKIYRSGVMSSLTAPDIAYLNSLGVTIVCDLRSASERTSEPSMLIGDERIKIKSHDYELASSMSRMMVATSKAQAVDAFADAYINFLDTLKPQYTDMFASLVESDAPFALNCTAGKDRTGVGSALILSVLGVDREAVIADYALSQTFVPPSYYLGLARSASANASGGTTAQVSPFARMPPEVAAVMLGSDPDVMRLALGRVDRELGGPITLAKQRFGLTDASIGVLRRKYLA
jgi:protein-tyrosine phosphatase